jgi:DNA-3-methyladenine glycosylase II
MAEKIPIHSSTRILSPSKNLFASLARAIIYQQISGKAAQSIEKKFVTYFSGKRFPKPADITGMTDEAFQSVGISPQKRSYLRDLAHKWTDGTIQPKKLSKMSDDDVRSHLIVIKGIGNWTIDMFLIFALNRPNILPTGDLGVQKGFQKIFKLRTLPDEIKMKKLAKPYDGEYTQLSLYAWSVLDNNTETM